jgi:hypothetical protein
MALGPDDVVDMDAGECETTDKIMQSVAGRPWDPWKAEGTRQILHLRSSAPRAAMTRVRWTDSAPTHI